MEKNFEESLEIAAKKALNKYNEVGVINEQETKIIYIYAEIYRMKNDNFLGKLMDISSLNNEFKKEIKRYSEE